MITIHGIRDFPEEAGCLSVLLGVQPGDPVQAVGLPTLPPSLAGAKWADTYTWQVTFWSFGNAFTCELKSEGPQPLTLAEIIRHASAYPLMWKKVLVKSLPSP